MAGSGKAHLRDTDDVLLRVEDIVVEYETEAGTVYAVSNVSLDVRRGETLGIVGESGCGKSTLGRAMTMLDPPTSGTIDFAGHGVTTLSASKRRQLRPKLQVIFQDPISALNPRRTVRKIIGEGPEIWGRKVSDEQINELIAAVGLDPQAVGDRRPGEMSGGQCQRVAIARALMLEPDVILCDEPVSSLDVSVQAQVLNLLERLREERELTLVFIAHDLGVVKNISDRTAVMYLGKLCEVVPSGDLHRFPSHPYTRALLEAIPVPDPEVEILPMEIAGDLPSPLAPPSGCRFRTRCVMATNRCAAEEPQMREVRPGHFAACHYSEDLLARAEAEQASGQEPAPVA
ncbi:oligopeptide/dipeptide ABC transporter ATP-binding protein [Arthrobacter sp. NPDC080031]|uniref:ABC transporter ATP-binding protein n=1 Tax=Arthrobacter sp. NPDC080031 TaxID=3155918 RepID=UPI00344B9E80